MNIIIHPEFNEQAKHLSTDVKHASVRDAERLFADQNEQDVLTNPRIKAVTTAGKGTHTVQLPQATIEIYFENGEAHLIGISGA